MTVAVINRFQGEYRWLSNFHECVVEYCGRYFLNTEAAYQAQKFGNPDVRDSFMQLSGKGAKKRGELCEGYYGVRDDWDDIKLDVMREVNTYKFTQHPKLRQQLLDTYPAQLIEGNTWGDQFWGVSNGKGKNHLGRILMEVRQQLRVEEMNRDLRLRESPY